MIVATCAFPNIGVSWAEQAPAFVLHRTVTYADRQTYIELPFEVPEGVTRVSIESSYTEREKHTTIDLGLFDGERFRGWSGGNKSSFTVSETDATPSYLPGPVRPGWWKLILGVPGIREGVRSEFTANIYFARAGNLPGVSTFSEIPLRDSPAWYRGDLHMHDAHSDGSCLSQSGKKVPCPLYKTEDPVGKHFGVGSIQYSGVFEIAGVFADFKMTDPRREPVPLFFRPMSQQFRGYKEPDWDAAEKSSMFLNFIILDFAQAPPEAEALARKTLAAIDPNLSVRHFSPYEAEVAGNFNQDRLLARLTSSFGVLALILASVGLYGVMSYSVVRRTSEIGIRMALGAARSGVVAMMLRGALWQLLIGLAIGIPAAMIAGHFMASLLYEVKPYDPLAFLAAILLLAICATVAAFIPARRAASIDPMQALRTD